MTWQFEWHDDWPGPGTVNIESDWQRAWEDCASGHVFQQPVLSRIWVENVALPRGEHPLLLIARNGRRTIYFPFTIKTQAWKRLRRRELMALGGNLVFDYQDPLVQGADMEASDWFSFWSGLYESSRDIGADFVHLEHLPEAVAKVGESGPLSSKIQCSPSTVAPMIDLRQFKDFEEVLAYVSANHRSKIRRKMRSVMPGNPRLVIFPGNDVDGALRMFDEMMIAYGRQYSKKRSGQMFADLRNVHFYKEMIRHGLPGGWLHVSRLEVGGVPISWHVGFLWKGRFYWYKPCYDIDKEHMLPGHLHIAYLLMEGLHNGWDVFDFTVGAERYKLSWATHRSIMYRLMWFPDHLRGKAHGWGYNTAQGIRRAIKEQFEKNEAGERS